MTILQEKGTKKKWFAKCNQEVKEAYTAANKVIKTVSSTNRKLQ